MPLYFPKYEFTASDNEMIEQQKQRQMQDQAKNAAHQWGEEIVDALNKPLDTCESDDDYMEFPSNHELNNSFGSDQAKSTRSRTQVDKNNVFLQNTS